MKPHCTNPRARSEMRQAALRIRHAERVEQRATRRGRLTDVERAERAMSERDFQRQVTDLAELLGWSWAHWRPLQNRRGMWQVPVEGPLGTGWPDLTLVRDRDRRLVFAELKRELEHVRPDQAHVLAMLGRLEMHSLADTTRDDCEPTIEIFVWHPSDLRDPIETSRIYEVLR